MNLSEINTKDLQKELNKRKEIENFNKFNLLKGDVLDYEVTDFVSSQYKYFYKIEVSDGSEGFTYILQSADLISDSQINDIIIDEVSNTEHLNTNSYYIDDIIIEEIGKYSLTFLKIN